MLVIGNWKGYVDSERKAKQLVVAAKKLATQYKKVQVVLAPSAPYIGLLSTGNRSKLSFAAQDVSVTSGGAQTGEVSAQILAGAHVAHVIVGHSERRALGESEEEISQKVRLCLSAGLQPIICIGETVRDAEAQYLKVIRTQLSSVMTPLSPKERAQVIVAYEPVWAIGKTALEAVTPDDLTEMVLYIRKALGEFLPGKSAQKVPVLYGGSVDASNAKILLNGTGVNGFLVGRASTDSKEFSGIIKAVA